MIDHTELEKFKEMLCTASPRDIAGVIVALARNPKNTVELMALCGFFHQHECPELAHDFWCFVKDPHTKEHASRFTSSFVIDGDQAYHAASGWLATVISAPEVELIADRLYPNYQLVLPQMTKK
jgi:hypothetical protein